MQRAAPNRRRARRAVRTTRGAGLLEVNGIRIFVKMFGSGPPLLLLHGGPGADHTDFLPYLRPLARRHRLVLIDQRGSGRSQRLENPKGYTLGQMVEDVEGVRRRLRLGKIALLGHSFGGLLAQAYAIRYPRSVRRLILAGTAASAAAINRDFRTIRTALPGRLRAQLQAQERRGIFRRDGQYRRSYARLCQRALQPYMYARAQSAARNPPENLVSGWEVLREMWVRRSDFRIDGNLRGFDMRRGLAKVAVPTLVINGARDIVSADSARSLAQALPRSRLVVMPHSTHMMFVDQPRPFVALVEAFLQRSWSAALKRELSRRRE